MNLTTFSQSPSCLQWGSIHSFTVYCSPPPTSPYRQRNSKTAFSKEAFSCKMQQYHVDSRYSNNVRSGGYKLSLHTYPLYSGSWVYWHYKNYSDVWPFIAQSHATGTKQVCLCRHSIVQTNKSDALAVTAQKGAHHLRKAAVHSKEATACVTKYVYDSRQLPWNSCDEPRSLPPYPALPTAANNPALPFVGLSPNCL